MKWIFHTVSCLLWISALTNAAVAQSSSAIMYPDRPIHIIVPWPPGGTTDLLARLLSQSLTESLHQSVVVENAAGAGGNVGTRRFVQTKPDGYTFLLASSSTNAANPYLYKNLGFDPIKDFRPVALIARVPNVLVVNVESPFTTVDGLIKAAKAKPGALSYASSGAGSSANLAGELLKSVARIDVLHVPYKGVAPALLDLLAGRVSFSFTTGIDGNIEDGKLRPLAVTAAQRAHAIPAVPTFEELGLDDVRIDVWFGLAGPADLPTPIVRTINSAVNNALSEGELKKQLLRLGSDVHADTPEHFSEFWASEVKRYADVVRLSGATLE
jgi:tripartite-type tricarboxylate transporter receptor subunit TctC